MKKVSPINATRIIGAALTAAAMFLPSSRSALADAAPEKGIVGFKYLNYKDSQPDQDRMDIFAYSVRAMTPVAGKWAIDVTGIYDSVSGASPEYHTYFDPDSVSGASSGIRRACDVSITRYFAAGSLTAGTSYSSESDYISRNISLQGSLLTPSRNTTITLGGSVTTDSISPTNGKLGDRKKTHAGLIGVTQVMSKNDIVQLNLGRSVGAGYYSDPYKSNDERPRHRNLTTIMGRWNHYIEPTEGVLKLSYRFYTDTFGIKSHTFASEYVQPLPNGFTITPMARYYSQTSANFYVPVGYDEQMNPWNATFPSDAPYTEDQRLSAFGAVTLSMKVQKRFADDWIVDVRYDHYVQEGRLGFSDNFDRYLKEFRAHYVQFGIAREF